MSSSNKTWTQALVGDGEDVTLGCPFVPKRVVVISTPTVEEALVPVRYEKHDTMPGALCLQTAANGTQTIIASGGNGITIGDDLHENVLIDASIAASDVPLYICCDGF